MLSCAKLNKNNKIIFSVGWLMVGWYKNTWIDSMNMEIKLCVFLDLSLAINNVDIDKLSKPKLNQQINSTEFEVRLHSYPIIHPTPHPHKLSVVVVNCPAS